MVHKKLLFLLFTALFFPLITKAQDIEVENLGFNVNSEYSEVSPIISPDGKTLFFARKGDPKNEGVDKNYDIWYSTLQADGTWSKAQNIGAPLNNDKSNDVQSISADGNSILVKGYYKNGVFTKGKGYSISRRTSTGWGNPEGIEIDNYENMVKGRFASAALSSNGQVMILAFSETPQSSDDDLYVSFKQGGTWSKPKAINQLNTAAYTETAPFIAADGKTLYFASNRPGGLGSNDIYLVKRLDDSWMNWSSPENVGAPINTSNWDAYYTTPASGDYAYTISSNNSLGKSDIMRVKMPEKAQPESVVLIYGTVYNSKTNQPIDITSSVLYEKLVNGEQAGITSTDAMGNYKIILPYGEKYGYQASANGFLSMDENIDLTNISTYQEIQKDLYLVPLEKGAKVRLNNIFFEQSKADLLAESFPELNRLVSILEQYPTLVIQLNGHTEIFGNERALMTLSKRRVEAVRNYLVKQGINGDRIKTKAFGGSEPITTENTPEARAKNRRVEIEVLDI